MIEISIITIVVSIILARQNRKHKELSAIRRLETRIRIVSRIVLIEILATAREIKTSGYLEVEDNF